MSERNYTQDKIEEQKSQVQEAMELAEESKGYYPEILDSFADWLDGGRTLSEKQLNVVESIIKENS